MANNILLRYTIFQDIKVKYMLISVVQIPGKICETLLRDFPDYLTEKALRGEDSTFKLIVSKKEVRKVLVFNKAGSLLKAENIVNVY